jgi:hypothetical protein
MKPLACKGKVVGKTVVLEEGADFPEGATVEVRWVPDHVLPTSAEERQRALQRLFSMNSPVDDWEKMEEEIAREVAERSGPR